MISASPFLNENDNFGMSMECQWNVIGMSLECHWKVIGSDMEVNWK